MINAATQTTGVVSTPRPIRCSTTTSGRARASCSSTSRRSGSTTTSRDKHRLSGSSPVIWADARSGLPEQRRRAVPRRAELPACSRRRGRCTRCTLRSTLSANMVNELRGGITALGGVVVLRQPTIRATARRRSTDQGGYALDFDPEHRPDRLVRRRTARAGAARRPTASTTR